MSPPTPPPPTPPPTPPTPTPRRRRRPLRTLGLLLVGGVGSVLAIAGLGLLWLNTAAGNRWLHQLILDQAAPYLPEATLEIEGFATRLPGYIDLRGITVTRWDGVVMAHADHLRLEYSLARLLGGEVNVDLLLLEAPDIRLEVMEDGRLDWLQALGILPTEPTPPTPWAGLSARIGLTLAQLDGGRLTYVAAPDTEPLVVEGISLAGAAHVGGGRLADIPHISVQATPVPYDTLFLEGGLQYRDSVITTDDLALMMGGSLLQVRGVVADAEVQPLLDLQVDALPLAKDTLTPFVGQALLLQDVSLAMAVRGTLADLGLGLSAATQAGSLTAQGKVYLSADPLAWMLEVRPDGLALEDLVAGVAEPVHLRGRYRVEGSGTAWPQGITAALEAEAPEQVIWGQPVEVLEVDAALEAGVLTFTRAFARHAVGEARITGGSVDLVSETASLRADVQVPSLGALRDFGLVGYQGSISASGPVRAAWGGESPTVNATLTIEGSAIGSADFSLGRVATDALVVQVEGESVRWSGDARLESLGASGLQIASLDLAALTGSYSTASGAVQAETQLTMGTLLVGDGSFVLDGLTGGLRAGLDAHGSPFVETEEMVLSSMLIVPIGFALDGGPVSLSLEDDQLLANLTLSRDDRVVVSTDTRGDLGTGRWVVDKLFVFPAAEYGIANPTATPIEFTLSGEDGLSELALVLVLSGQDPREVDPRQLALEKASYITLQGGTGGENPDLALGAHRIDLAWVGEVVNLFLSKSPEEPYLAPMTGTLDVIARVEGIGADSDVTADLKLRGFSFPEIADAITIHLGVREQLGSPAFSLDVRSAEEKLMLAAEGRVPLDLAAGGLDCDRELRVRALLAPIALPRLQQRLPALVGLPEGDASADVHITGSACDPSLRMVAAYAGPIGTRSERGRLDVVVERSLAPEQADAAVDAADGADMEPGHTLSIEAFAEEGGARRLEVRGEAADHLAPLLTWAIHGGEAPDLEDPATYVGDFQINVVPLELPLAMLARLGGLSTAMTGSIVGGVSLSGDVADPAVTGGLVLLDTRIGDTDVTAAQLSLLPATDDQQREGYQLSAMLDFEQKGRLAISGFMPLTLARLRDEEEDALYTADGWTLTAEGPGVPLELLNGLVDGVEDARGLLSLEGGLKGSLRDLSSELRLRIRDGALTYAPLDIRYEDIQLDVRQNGEQLTLHSSSMRSRPLFGLGVRPPGTLTLSGTTALIGMMPGAVALDVGMDDFSLIATQEMRIATSGALKVQGTWPALSVDGSLRLTEGTLNLEDSFFTGNADLGIDERLIIVRGDEVDEEAMLAALGARREEKDAEASEFMQKLRARVAVDLNNNLRLDMSYPLESSYGEQLAQLTSFGLGADMTGELTASYINNNLDLVGTVEISRGEADILTRRFAVESGSEVRFIGGDYANPFLDIQARYVTQQYGDVVLNISNTAAAPKFGYSSENAEQDYDQSDLFAILLLGRPASALADSEGESSMNALSLALSTVTGSVSSALGGTVVDEVDWDPESGVRIGKSISEKLFLVYDRNSNPDDTENINQVTLEWLISRRLYAEFRTGDRAQSAANIYWRRIFGEAGTEVHNPHLMPGSRDEEAPPPEEDAQN